MTEEADNNILIRNALLINEGEKRVADLTIGGDTILSISSPGSTRPAAGARVIEAAGLWLLPGIIDTHVHFREPGLTHKGDIASESAAAAAGGVTSFMEMPNTLPQTITIADWEFKNSRAAAASVINYSFYLGATNNNISELRRANPELVPAIKLFLGASTGNMLVSDSDALEALFNLGRLPVACHCEDESIIRENIKSWRSRYGEDIDPSSHPQIRSREAAFLSSSAAVARARRAGTRLHLLHLTSAEEMTLLTPAGSLSGKLITGEACVHHLWFDEDDYRTKGNLIKWNPPIRSSSDREALISAVNDGRIDVISTDHAPHTLEEKMQPYFSAPSGGPLIQHSLVMMLELCHRGELTPERVVEKMCHNGATLYGMDDRGFIREGWKADLVLVNPDAPWRVDSTNILYKCGWSPLEGTTFRSRVISTFVNGIAVFEDGRLTGRRAAQILNFKRKVQ